MWREEVATTLSNTVHKNVVDWTIDIGYGIGGWTRDPNAGRGGWSAPHVYKCARALFEWESLRTVCRDDEIPQGREVDTSARKTSGSSASRSGKQVARNTFVFLPWRGVTGSTHLAPIAVANLIRNYWSIRVIFWGHFPDAWEVPREEFENETQAGGTLRQMLGSANFQAGACGWRSWWQPLLPDRTHWFPDPRAIGTRKTVVSVRASARSICLPYTSGSLCANTLSRLDDPQASGYRQTPQGHLRRRPERNSDSSSASATEWREFGVDPATVSEGVMRTAMRELQGGAMATA